MSSWGHSGKTQAIYGILEQAIIQTKQFNGICGQNELSRDTRFPTMWYVRPAKPQISLRIRAAWSRLNIYRIRADWSRLNILLTVYNLEFLSLKGGCTDSSESTLVKIPNYWKSHVAAHLKSKILESGQVSDLGREMVEWAIRSMIGGKLFVLFFWVCSNDVYE